MMVQTRSPEALTEVLIVESDKTKPGTMWFIRFAILVRRGCRECAIGMPVKAKAFGVSISWLPPSWFL
jgi:hypothetical protein